MSKFEEAAQAAEEVLDILAKAFATGNIRFSFARRPDGEVVAVLGTTYGGETFLPIAEISNADNYEFLAAPEAQ